MFKFLPLVLLLVFVSCGKEDNEKITGTYIGNVNCLQEGGPFETTITISAVSNTSDQVNIILVSDGETANFKGTVSGDALTIPEQSVDGNDITSATGTLKDKTLTLAFIVADDVCTFIGNK